jgi:hypothetical protein
MQTDRENPMTPSALESALAKLRLSASHVVDDFDKGLAEITGKECAALLAKIEALEADHARMQYLEDEPVHVEVRQYALADTGDYGVDIAVIERHMDERRNRRIGSGGTWREAIDDARNPQPAGGGE